MQGKDICTVSRQKSQDELKPYIEGPTDSKRKKKKNWVKFFMSCPMELSEPESDNAPPPVLPEGTASCSHATG